MFPRLEKPFLFRPALPTEKHFYENAVIRQLRFIHEP
jgi:hypothetical protein